MYVGQKSLFTNKRFLSVLLMWFIVYCYVTHILYLNSYITCILCENTGTRFNLRNISMQFNCTFTCFECNFFLINGFLCSFSENTSSVTNLNYDWLSIHMSVILLIFYRQCNMMIHYVISKKLIGSEMVINTYCIFQNINQPFL